MLIDKNGARVLTIIVVISIMALAWTFKAERDDFYRRCMGDGPGANTREHCDEDYNKYF